MKCLQRYLCVFLCFVLLSLAFSLNVSAEDKVDIGEYTIDFDTYLYEYPNYNILKSWSLNNYDPFNEEIQRDTYSTVYIGKISNVYINNRWKFKPKNSNTILASGGEVTTVLVKAQANVLLQYMDASQNVLLNNYDRNLKGLYIQLYYIDGTIETIKTGEVSIVDTNNHNFKFKFTPENDVTQFVISTDNTFAEPTGYDYVQTQLNVYHGDYFDTNGGWELTVTQDSKEVGLLNGIIQWIKSIFEKIGSIFDSVTQGFSNIGKWFSDLGTNISNWFTNLVNNIVELPSKIWQFISDGLKSLFVPTEDFIVGFKNDIDNILKDRFGAIYEVGTIISDFASQITYSDQTNIINMPEVSLESVGIPFSFGGYDVLIVPQGFETVVNILKKIISMAMTFLFINGLRKRYDEVMGVEV